jgi:hypothetical protein
MGQRKELGNQQERLGALNSQDELDLYYLAGFFDGEGYVGLTTHCPRGNTYFIPLINVTNTNMVVIENIGRILSNHSIAFHVTERRAQTDNWKRIVALECAGFRRTFKFLWVIEPLLIGKRLQAQMTMAYIWSRLKSEKKAKVPYSDNEIILYRALKELNVRGPKILNEYTPKAVEFTAKMYSELRTKGVESAEMTGHPYGSK